jgi:hypothetical protein
VLPGPTGWRLEHWRAARARWRAALLGASSAEPASTVFAVADVRECYTSIAPATVAAALGPAAEAAVGLLRRFAEAGVRGLPVGPDPSAVIANAVLAGLDLAVASAGVRHLRWVDDVVLWGERASVVRALVELRAAAAALGLHLHDGKTRLLDDREGLLATAARASGTPVRAAPSGARIIATPCGPSTEPRAS